MGMGYQGFAKFYETGPDTTPLLVLCTGASVNLVLEPIYSSAVWGAGWYNASTTHYADAAIRFEGNIDFELQGGKAIWNFMRNWIIEQRAYSRSLDISPDGSRVYQYHNTTNATYDLNGAWNTSASFNTSEGSFVMVSAGVVALDRNEYDADGTGNAFSDYTYILQRGGVVGTDCANLASLYPLNPGGGNINPIPFWKTNAALCRGSYADGATTPLCDTGLETVEWSIDVSQNNIVLYTCNGTRLPSAMLQGPMDVTGSVVLYNTKGVFDPILGPNGTGGGYSTTRPFLYAENTWLTIAITGVGASNAYIQVPAVVVESDDYSIAGMDAVTNRTFSIKGLGGRCSSGTPALLLPPCYVSLAT